MQNNLTLSQNITGYERDIQVLNLQISEYRTYREDCLNLIASENIVSPFVLNHLEVSLESRYGDYYKTDLTRREYRGSALFTPIEQTATKLIGEIFGAGYVDLRPLSGHIAGAAALLALCKPGDIVLEPDQYAGGHCLAERLAVAGLIDLKVMPLPFDAINYNIDAAATLEAIKKHKPKVVILGTSNMLFPHPVAKIAAAVKSVGNCYLMYDASHPLGLIAGGIFQQPLIEGADLMVTSTHKTFAGPQGGMVLTNDVAISSLVSASIYPALVTNHHLARIPAMAARAIEIKAYGQEYAFATVANARALGEALQNCGFKVVGNRSGCTESHTVCIQSSELGNNTDLTLRLEEANIICGEIGLPKELGTEGIRIGVQELTRLGLKPGDTIEIAKVIATVIFNTVSLEEAKEIVKKLARRFKTLQYAIE